MTLFYMTLDPDNERLQWVRAGHDPAILYDPNNSKFEELTGNGIALGINEDFRYEQNVKTGFAEGQVIAIGTDGIWEASNTNGEMFGKRRFRNIISQNANRGASHILNAVYDELDHFTKGLKSEDDITLVVAKLENQ